MEITEISLQLFIRFAKDAGNWNGTPLLDGNFSIGSALRGNLTQLKKAGLVATFKDDGCTWVEFPAAGIALAAAHGITI